MNWTYIVIIVSQLKQEMILSADFDLRWEGVTKKWKIQRVDSNIGRSRGRRVVRWENICVWDVSENSADGVVSRYPNSVSDAKGNELYWDFLGQFFKFFNPKSRIYRRRGLVTYKVPVLLCIVTKDLRNVAAINCEGKVCNIGKSGKHHSKVALQLPVIP